MSTHRNIIFLETVTLGERGQRYRVIHEGITLIGSTRLPEFDCCRLLLTRGISGRLEVWHKGATFPAMILDIENGARLTIEESDRIGPRFAHWRPRSEEAVASSVSRSCHSPRTGSGEIQVGRQPAQQDRAGNDPPPADFQLETEAVTT